MKSREHVKNHAMFKQLFSGYADAIGINNEEEIPEWTEYLKVKKAADEAYEQKKKLQEEKKQEELKKAEDILKAEETAKA